MLREGLIDDINGCVDAAEHKFSINFSKAKTKVCLSLHYNGDKSYFFVNRNKIKFKADNRNVNSSQKKYHLKEIFMIFLLIMTPLISLKFR